MFSFSYWRGISQSTALGASLRFKERFSFSYPYKKCFVLLSYRGGFSQSTALGVNVRFRERFPYPYKDISFSSPTDVGSTILSDFDANYPLWPVMYRHQPHDFKTHLLGRCFHILIRMFCSPLQPMWDWILKLRLTLIHNEPK